MVVGGFRSLHVLVLTQKTDSLTFKQVSSLICSSAPSTFTEMEESDPMTNNICELCFKHREFILAVYLLR